MRYYLPFLLLSVWASLPASAQELPQNAKPFGLWVEEFRQEALAQGIAPATLDDAFAGMVPLDRVIALDRKQPESVLTLEQYLASTVNDKRVAQGQALLAENRALLQEIGARYGVQPRFIVALWGIETSFGAHMGGFNTVNALATLAYDGRRADFFRGELLKALQILQQEHMAAADMKGSWAGAMGQCQFMPDSFLNFAVDYDGDGKRDIWNDKADVFASIANYLASSGWHKDEGWGREVQLPDGFDRTLADIAQEKPLAQWNALGIRTVDGQPLPARDIPASLIMAGTGDDAVPMIIYGNYKVLLKWNRSRFFATAVGTLADRIGQ